MDYPRCTFSGRCIFMKRLNCSILNDMPKPRKSGACPFQKERLEDIAGREETTTKVEKKEGIWKA